jgi:beta-glucanase (GH16 family)
LLLAAFLTLLVVAGGLGAFIVSKSAQHVPPPEGPNGSWGLAWNDEFDGTSLQADRWRPGRDAGTDAPFQGSGEAAWFSPSSVSVQDGSLRLTLQQDLRDLDGTTYPYRTGVVTAKNAFLVKPGSYIEARIKVPSCDGCWPAFWLVPTDRWPPEIDIFEYFGTQAQTRPSFNYHTPSEDQTGPDRYGEPGVDYRADFHVYGLLWDGTQAVPYLDGRAYPAIAATEDMTSLPLMMILNLSVQADHHPQAGAQMQVDWVRVWRQR